MIIIKILLLLLHFTIVPVAVGNLITSFGSAEINKSPIVLYVTGFFGQLAAFYLLCTAVSIVQDFARYRDPIRGCFVVLCVIYTMLLVGIVIWWFFEVFQGDEDKEQISWVKGVVSLTKAELVKQEKKIFSYIYMAIIGIALAVQVFFAITYQANEYSYDDFDYVAASESNIANNVITITSYLGSVPSTSAQRMSVSWTTYISYLSVVTQFDCATICHSCLTVLLLLIAYLIYFYMSGTLTREFENRLIFICLIAALFVFGYYSHYSNTFRLLCTIWQGKAVLYSLVIPFMLVYLPRIINLEKELDIKDFLPLFAISLGASSLTVMSILLISILTVGIWAVMSINERKIVGIKTAVINLLGPGMAGVFYLIFKVVENTGRSL